MSRERPDRDAPEGYHYEAYEADGWRVGGRGRQCRRQRGANYSRVRCPAPAVAELLRGHGNNWWAYCSDHLFGRWVEDGRVMYWRLVQDAEES